MPAITGLPSTTAVDGTEVVPADTVGGVTVQVTLAQVAGLAGSVATDVIWDAAGDLAVGSGSNTAVRLPRGSALQQLRVNAGGTDIEWATISASGVSPSFNYKIDTGSTADSDPGAGLLKYNNATQSSATFLYIDDVTDDTATDLSTFFGSLGSSGFVHLIQSNDATKWQLWKWTATPTDGTGYWKFAVTLQASAASFTDDVDVQVLFIGGGGGSSTVGRQELWVPAGAIRPRISNGCATHAPLELTAGQPDLLTLDHDATTQEFHQFSIRMPPKWNEGTVTAIPLWSHAATATNFGVVWSLAGVAISDDDAQGVSFGTAQTSTDTGGTTNDLYFGPETSAITIAGTPAAGDLVYFQGARVPADGGDTLAVDARLHGWIIVTTTAADTDA